MEEFCMVCLLVLFAVAAITLFTWANTAQARSDGWEEAGQELGLRFSVVLGAGRRLSGRYRELRVDLAERETKDGEGNATLSTHLTVKGEHVCQGYELNRRGFGSGTDLGRWVGELFASPSRPLTGDVFFDAQVGVSGSEARALAALSYPVRELLPVALRTVRPADGLVSHQSPGTCGDARQLVALVVEAADLAARLSVAPADVPEALASNAASDPVAAVRLRNLEVLAASFAETPAARRIASTLYDAPDAGTRLAAAKLTANPVAQACLVKLIAPEGGATDAQRASALEHLLATYPRADLGQVVEAALGADVGELRRVAARAIASGGHLAQLGARFAAPLAAPIESLLVTMATTQPGACRVAAVRALGTTGALEVVESLVPLTKGLMQSGDVQLAARDAIRRIQERCGARGAGGLAVVAGREGIGGLSVPVLDGAVSVVGAAAPWGK